MAKELKWQPVDFDDEDLMDYIRSMGAASVNEIKDYFHTDSASTRTGLAYLWFYQRIWMLSQGNTLYATENTHKRGFVNIKGLRRKAGVQPKKRGPKPKELSPELKAELDQIAREEAEKERRRRMRAFENGEYHPGER